MRTAFSTTIVWAAALTSLLGAGILAAMFALMATSLDPLQAVEAGVAPWIDAVYAALAFLGVVVTTVVALAAWHSRRFTLVGAALAVAQVGVVIWASLKVFTEYF